MKNEEKEIFDLQVQVERLQVQIEVLTATLWKAKVLPLAEWHLPKFEYPAEPATVTK